MQAIDKNKPIKITIWAIILIVTSVLLIYKYYENKFDWMEENLEDIKTDVKILMLWKNEGGRFTSENWEVLQKDIDHNREAIVEIKSDIKEIKNDVKALLNK